MKIDVKRFLMNYKKIIILAVIGIIVIIVSYIALRQSSDTIMQENKIKEAEFREKLFALNAKLVETETEKEKLLIVIEDMKKNEVQVQEPGKVETVIVNQIEYVPKVEYVKVYNNYSLFRNISGKYASFALLDVTAKEDNAKIKDEYERRIAEMQKAIDKLYKRTKGFHILVGPQAGISLSAPYVGFGVTIGWLIK